MQSKVIKAKKSMSNKNRNSYRKVKITNQEKKEKEGTATGSGLTGVSYYGPAPGQTQLPDLAAV